MCPLILIGLPNVPPHRAFPQQRSRPPSSHCASSSNDVWLLVDLFSVLADTILFGVWGTDTILGSRHFRVRGAVFNIEHAFLAETWSAGRTVGS